MLIYPVSAAAELAEKITKSGIEVEGVEMINEGIKRCCCWSRNRT